MELNRDTLWALVNSIPYGVLIVDRDCRVVAVNEAYTRMFDDTWDNIVGKDFPAMKKDSYLPCIIE